MHIKKSIFISIFVCLGAFGVGMIIYQNKLLQESEKRMEEYIMGQLEYRLNTEDAIKRELESKRKEKELVMQFESERQLKETLDIKLAEYNQRQMEFSQELKDDLDGQLQDSRKQQLKYTQELAQQGKRLLAYEAQLAEYAERLSAQKDEQIESSRALEAMVTQQLDGYKQRLSEYEAQLAGYSKKVREQNRQLAELKLEFEEYKNKSGREPLQPAGTTN